MHMVSFSIGGAPSDEPCAQTGITTNWVTLQQLECTVYRAALIARFSVFRSASGTSASRGSAPTRASRQRTPPASKGSCPVSASQSETA